MTKLNLGCGHKKIDGFIGVDKYPPADICFDLEEFGDFPDHEGTQYRFNPWPFENNSVDEILMSHSLEHMGATTESFFHIIKELYRVCKHDAKIVIDVPHPRSDGFLGDPTHVRPITPAVLSLFDKARCDDWTKLGWPNTQLAYHLDVDFRIADTTFSWHPNWADDLPKMSEKEIALAVDSYNNVITEYHITLRVVKNG